MTEKKIFKNLIRAQLLLLICFIYLGFDASLNDTSLAEDVVISSLEVAVVIVALVYIINLYLLFKFKPIGKLLFVPLVLISVFLSLALPTEYFQLSSPLEYLLETLTVMIDGAIITMLYLTSIKDNFES